MTNADDFSDRLQIVPFCPWACPECGDTKPHTYGQNVQLGMRYHRCKECNTKYRSVQLDDEQLEEWVDNRRARRRAQEAAAADENQHGRPSTL